MYERGAHSSTALWFPYSRPAACLSLTPDGRHAAAAASRAQSILACVSRNGLNTACDGTFLARGSRSPLSFFDGFNHLPQFETQPLSGQPLVAVRRSYAPLRMAGTDAAIPLRWFTVKGEIAALMTSSDDADDVVLYVVQVERQIGELSLVGGYAGEIVVTESAAFDYAPDRGLTRAFLGRAGYTVNANSDVSFEAAVRQNLDGVWIKGQYSKALDSPLARHGGGRR